MAIDIPKNLKGLLEDSDLQAPIRALTDRAGEILADNKLAFFPDYTNHGIDHIECVLKSEVDLVPKQVWDESREDSDPRLLHDADAAVIIGATLLHDIAMHLRPAGFRELVGRGSRFQPLPWFRESHEGHLADLPWYDLWENYVREARRFSERDLTNIVGELSARNWKFENLPDDSGKWETNHHLVVGEFIRRHHARLAHEIAIYGFPGLPVGSGEGQFPALGKEQGHVLMQLADLIGLVARSHGTSLRVCKLYLDASPLYPGTPRPMGTAVFYPMALLRVADYLQIDRQRAPAVLMQLRNPQSPVSVQEWHKHRAVQNIGPATDPRGKMVTVSTNLSLPLYLQLRDLLAGLQSEMDHSTAVLDEVYGARAELGLNKLNLSTRRVYSNLNSPIYRDSLPYVPDGTGFTADPNLLTLLVEPLYGKHPTVGVRELMQNAVDAVRELDVWCESHKISVHSLDLPEQDGDVLVEFIERDDHSWFVRVSDCGIGMTADTVQNYFLRAGASFRRSSEWAREFVDECGKARVSRAGRFGIGVFAVFLLGPSFRLRTRHASAPKSMGYAIEASENSQLIKINRVEGLCVGTTIEVEIDRDKAKLLGLEPEDQNEEEEEPDYGDIGRDIDWYCWDWPKIVKRVALRAATPHVLTQEYSAPIPSSEPSPEWSIIHPEGFDAVYWTFGDAPPISCNGLRLANPEYFMSDEDLPWPEATQLKNPRIAVLDSAANLPLTIQRYELSQETLPFIDELTRDVMLSFIAYALVCGPASAREAFSSQSKHPLQMGHITNYDLRPYEIQSAFDQGRLRWCTTTAEMVPADPWLYSLLNASSCLVYGEIGSLEYLGSSSVGKRLLSHMPTSQYAALRWDGNIDRRDKSLVDFRKWPARMLQELAHTGVAALQHNVETSQVLVSATRDFDFQNGLERKQKNRGRRGFVWQAITRPNSQRDWFSVANEAIGPSKFQKSVIEDMEARRSANVHSRWRGSSTRANVLYAAEIQMKSEKRTPESLIAKLWNECLGARAIPFNVAARQSMIEHGSGHSELKRHIELWKQLKSVGSKWVKSKS